MVFINGWFYIVLFEVRCMSKLVTLLSLGIHLSFNLAAASAAELESSGIGFKTVDEAYQALNEDTAAVMTNYEGWIVYNQKRDGVYILWSFTPLSHPANPSVVRREISKHGTELSIRMSALCESEKSNCDGLIEDFRIINENIKEKHSGG